MLIYYFDIACHGNFIYGFFFWGHVLFSCRFSTWKLCFGTQSVELDSVLYVTCIGNYLAYAVLAHDTRTYYELQST